MNKNPLEKDIEKHICEYGRSLGVLCYKFTSPSRAAVPDRLLITPNGVVFFMELKRKGEVPTASQRVEISKIQKTGVRVFIVDNVQDGKNVINAMMKKTADPLAGY